jgi:hypothetical protein
VRACAVAGVTSTLATAGTTSTVHRSAAEPAAAEIDARPGATACSSPSFDTRTTAGLSLDHCTRSLRRSSALE